MLTQVNLVSLASSPGTCKPGLPDLITWVGTYHRAVLLGLAGRGDAHAAPLGLEAGELPNRIRCAFSQQQTEKGEGWEERSSSGEQAAEPNEVKGPVTCFD